MENQPEILEAITQYLSKYPAEQEGLVPFLQFLNSYKDEQLYDRKNFDGHITASAFIVNPANKTLLLLKHKALSRWLQPGGHVDFTDEDLITAALREATEETGISLAELIPVTETVIDYNSHIIPANAKKQEPEHYHHDVRFLFSCSAKENIKIAEEESTGSKWIPFTELKVDADFGNVVIKIEAILN